MPSIGSSEAFFRKIRDVMMVPISARSTARAMASRPIVKFRFTETLPASVVPTEDVLFRLIDRKGVFEWQQGVLVSWDGTTMTLLVTHNLDDAVRLGEFFGPSGGVRNGSVIEEIRPQRLAFVVAGTLEQLPQARRLFGACLGQ